MRQKSVRHQGAAERTIKDIRRQTRKQSRLSDLYLRIADIGYTARWEQRSTQTTNYHIGSASGYGAL